MLKYLFGFFKEKEYDSSFWGHVDILRKYIFRSIFTIFIFSILAFIYKDFIFNKVILLPGNTDFFTYRAFCYIGQQLGIEGFCFQSFKISLINTDIGGQFRYHLMISLISGIILSFPFMAYQLWLFVKPALSEKELKSSRGIIFYISLLFIFGVLFGYYLVSPLTINFLATYQLSAEIQNMITISSYISILSILTLSMGIVFELPVLIYFLTKIGLLSSQLLRKYRRHSIVVISILAAFITPSGDMFSMLLVGFPIWVLFEISIYVSKSVERRKKLEI